MSDGDTQTVFASLEAVQAVSVSTEKQEGRKARKRGPTALQQTLGRLVPILLVFYILIAARLVLIDACPIWPHPQREMLRWSFAISLAALLTQFGWLMTRSTTYAQPPRRPPIGIVQRTAIFECDVDGKPLACRWCPGWLPARARHCRECQACQTGFDHHCPWIGRCVTSKTIKPFLLFLATVPFTIGVGLIAVVPAAWSGLRKVLRTTWDDEMVAARWWKLKRSWAIGPVWRHAYGLVLTYRRYRELNPELSTSNSLASPHFGPVLIAAIAVLLIAFCIILLGMCLKYIANGQTTIEVTRASGRRKTDLGRERYVWLPSENEKEGKMVRIDADLRLYDLGAAANLRQAFGSGWQALGALGLLQPSAHLTAPWIAAPSADGLSYAIAPQTIAKLRSLPAVQRHKL